MIKDSGDRPASRFLPLNIMNWNLYHGPSSKSASISVLRMISRRKKQVHIVLQSLQVRIDPVSTPARQSIDKVEKAENAIIAGRFALFIGEESLHSNKRSILLIMTRCPPNEYFQGRTSRWSTIKTTHFNFGFQSWKKLATRIKYHLQEEPSSPRTSSANHQ